MLDRARGRLSLAAALVIALLAFAVPATAAASTPDTASAYAIATEYWGAVPCGGNVAMAWTDLDPTMNALSTWSAPPGGGPQSFTGCRIDFNRQIPFDEGRMCSAMVHEVGHLLGQQHSHDPASPMSEEYTGPVGPCARFAAAAPAEAGDEDETAETTAASRPRRHAKRTCAAKFKRASKRRRKLACRRPSGTRRTARQS